MKIAKITLVCMMLASAVFIYSCKKNDAPNPGTTTTTTTDTEVSSANDNALAENTSNDIESIGAQVSDGSNLNNARQMGPEDLSLGCVGSISVNNNIITVTFNGDTCNDGRARSGQLNFNLGQTPAKHYRDPGFSMIITSGSGANAYKINGKTVTVYKTVTNVTDTTTGFHFDSAHVNERWHITANLSITNDDGTITWNCDRNKELLNTSDTSVYHGDGPGSRHITWSKARVGISGNANGTTAGGEVFAAQTTSPLIRDFGACSPWTPFIRGTVDFTPGIRAVRHIDYGYMKNPPDSCDNWISITVKNTTTYRPIW